MGILKSLGRMTVSSSGTGTITLNAAVSGFLTFDLAGCSTAAAGSRVTYAINDTTQSEIATGVYISSSKTLTRGSSANGLKSTNSDSAINMSNAAQVFIAPMVIGGAQARHAVGGADISKLAAAYHLEMVTTERCGPDVQPGSSTPRMNSQQPGTRGPPRAAHRSR